MLVISIVGARPQFVKLAPIHRALTAAGADHAVVHSGQHYDFSMSQTFFDGLSLPKPKWNLAIGSGSLGDVSARMISAMTDLLSELSPDWLVLYGDTTTTLAGSIVARQLGLRSAHVEAGLRSFNRQMPEEMNRVVADHMCDLLFAPTDLATKNLAVEGLDHNSVQVGDVMADTLLGLLPDLPQTQVDADPYLVCTLHRASNTDDPDRLRLLASALSRVDVPIRLVAHPRLRARAEEFGVGLSDGRVVLSEPLPYLEMMKLVRNARGVITDSGGLQKEAFLLGVPCTTLRAETEWVETLEGRWNLLDPEARNLEELLTRSPEEITTNPYGDGRAAERIAQVLFERGRQLAT